MAVAIYHEEYDCYPPAYLAGPDGRPWHSWRVLILPYMEQTALYEEYRFDEPWDGPRNRLLAKRMPEMFAFNDEDVPGNTTTNYLAVVGPETVWPAPHAASRDDVSDSLENTVLVVENAGAGVHWMEPRDLSFADMDFALHSPAGVSSKYQDPAVVTLDESVRKLGADLPPETLRAMLTINGGEQIQESAAGELQLLPDGRQRAVRER